MNSQLTLKSLLALVLFLSACSASQPPDTSQTPAPTSRASQNMQTADAAPHNSDAHDHGGEQASQTDRVPAFQTDTASLKHLPPTLSPEQFKGNQKIAYAAVKEIPQTIAQLPCYCYCDRGFGHKSLHSCFVDDHASHCAVCVDEALLAHRLQKQEGLTPSQIRERIVAQYSEK